MYHSDMRMLFEDSTVVKEATEPSDVERLRAEAEVLRATAHPGVVTVCSFSTDASAARLTLRRIDGTPAAKAGPQPLDVTAGWAAALATTVADLHDLGYAHGAVAADHVIIDPAGRPILCGFGHAAASDFLKKEDVARLAALTASWLPEGDAALRRLHRKLARFGGGPTRFGGGPTRPGSRRTHFGGRRTRPGGARELAAAILDAVPTARLAPPRIPASRIPAASPEGDAATGPAANRASSTAASPAVASPEPPATGTMAARPERRTAGRFGVRVSSRRHWVLPVASVISAAVAAIVVTTASSPHSRAGQPPAGRSRPARSAGAPVLLGHYRLDPSPGEDPVTVLGRWWCASATPAVLDTRSGTVWVFRAWPAAGQSTSGERAAQVDGAVGIAAEAGGSGCDRLVVLTRGGHTTTVNLSGVMP